jgi:hypothetical protein
MKSIGMLIMIPLLLVALRFVGIRKLFESVSRMTIAELTIILEIMEIKEKKVKCRRNLICFNSAIIPGSIAKK